MNDQQKTLRILQLYPKDMNIYGDNGNVLVLKKRSKWHGYTPEILHYNPGDSFPEDVDLVIGGGGQDSGQDVIQDDLIGIKPQLHRLAHDDVPMLMVCGLYQLFGRFFKTSTGHMIEGIGIFDLETHGSGERMIGNIISHSEYFGDIIGYENHSGKTYLGPSVEPLGRLVKGAGNNGEDDSEGARFRNVIGTYLHGSLLPKNPLIADFLIETALTKKYGDFTPNVIDDSFADEARRVAVKRPR